MEAMEAPAEMYTYKLCAARPLYTSLHGRIYRELVEERMVKERPAEEKEVKMSLSMYLSVLWYEKLSA
jgi:hypothetical protein